MSTLSLLWLLLLYSLALLAVVDVLLTKDDPRAALGWLVVCLALPGFGALLYWLLGRNRIRNRAQAWKQQGNGMQARPRRSGFEPAPLRAPFQTQNYVLLRRLADTVTRRPLLDGNQLELLHNGEQAYPAMLAAIDAARERICLSSYIFDTRQTGRRFAAALIRASRRGVEVRVLVDALGEFYTWPRARRLFRASDVRFVLFLPFTLKARGAHINLRNHRKLLLIDGQIGFTGGMNISQRHCVAAPGRRAPVVDLHFQVRGPVVAQMQEAFIEDWQFASGERLPPLEPQQVSRAGESLCRGVSAGPNEDYEKLQWLISGVLSCARRRVAIMTPYFAPEPEIVRALCGAALRGVQVDILLPRKNNLPFVDWAGRASFAELLHYGVRLYYQNGPFVHSKLLLMDDHYAQIGSANFDARSLRLNFEFNLEVYDEALNRQLRDHFDCQCQRAQPLRWSQLQHYPLTLRLRDRFVRLFTPFL
ncbi:cardiolipin synthase [Desulfuromonas thiophila]|uniref:cardiolipin synthase n=1 Tax=Desulfuromonas thiophila TaxID=57664 RepID=UPI0024A7FBBC|nr:cardiolipin synthase [Desulfuromonas thiophila]